jgi:hypothetical protein
MTEEDLRLLKIDFMTYGFGLIKDGKRVDPAEIMWDPEMWEFERIDPWEPVFDG